ncbi:hypothetical protein COY27_00015 [Candidatus Woesearchaeota archaeon CG_4_10_14_0_2_um_filter_33_13]|nr:MAG: hypothetical protein COY27_00015 [Candidatus Woesearchaeota archaeon CG_4_10_14_0_2_um_filter_33_13]
MQEIILKAREWALEEIERNLYPKIEGFNFSNKKGQELAENLGADKDLVLLGTILMDIKLGECFQEGKIQEHVQRSVIAVKDFLTKFELNKETKDKIINCVEAHHGKNPFRCKEAEICANADCYRFINTRLFLIFLKEDDTFNTFEELIEFLDGKLEEKWKTLSLNFCKEELEKDYKLLKELIKRTQK